MAKESAKRHSKKEARGKGYASSEDSQNVTERASEYLLPHAPAIPRTRASIQRREVPSNGRNLPTLVPPRGEVMPARASTIMAPATRKPESQMTSIEKMEATRKGISKNALEELKGKAGFDYDQLSNVLGVARATLINKKGTEKFPQMLSEKIMSLADLYSFGYEVFGSQEEFNRWVFEPIPALGQQAPYALLDSQYGREEVKNLIGRIAHGVYS